jgi:hypothetical protein
LIVGDNFYFAVLENSDTRVRGAKINADSGHFASLARHVEDISSVELVYRRK